MLKEKIKFDWMSDAQILERMKELNETWHDPERAHEEADDLLCAMLCKLGHKELVEEFNKLDRWYA